MRRALGSGFWLAGWRLLLLVASVAAAGEPAGVRVTRLPVVPPVRAGFSLLAPDQTGVRFTNVLSDAKAAENQIRLNGSGVALGDVDGDGWCDLYLCGLEPGNGLYRNLGGWKFTNVTDAAGVGCAGQYSTGAAFADVDGDGDLDLLVNGIGTGTRLFLNDGHGHFTESTDSGLRHDGGATSLTLADIDGDGDLDLYVANYRTTTIRTTGFAVMQTGNKRMILPEDRDHLAYTPTGTVLEFGEPDTLYLNDGQGRFTAASWTEGRFRDEDGKPLTRAPRDWGLSAMFRDVNGDGAPDLYVCNDFHTEDRLWLNDGHGQFRAAPRLALRHTPTFSMTVDFADVNRDGRDDFFVGDMLSRNHQRRLMQFGAMAPYEYHPGLIGDRPQFDRNALQLNRGDGTWSDVAPFAGLEASEWTWSAIFLDVDLDGFEDLLFTTGHMFDTQDMDAEERIRAAGPWARAKVSQKLLMFPKLTQAKLAFRNRGDLTFEEMGAAWGFDQVGVAHGMALADLDNDGDLDVVVNNLNGAAGLYRNEAAAPRVAVRLHGTAPNTQGTGAKLRLVGSALTQQQEMMAGGRYLSGDEAQRVFALRETPATLEVTWRSGRRSLITNLTDSARVEVDEAAAPAALVPPPVSPPAPWFRDVSDRLGHTHRSEPFDDFARQPLLPRRLSTLGPGVSWFDFDGDGRDDLFVGGGNGDRPGIFHNLGAGRFEPVTNAISAQTLVREQSALLGVGLGTNRSTLLAGSANSAGGLVDGPAVRAYEFGARSGDQVFAGHPHATGPLAVADVDGDGALDLFVGGRSVPGRWPEPASSRLYRNQGGRFVLDEAGSAPFAALGLVTGATFTDLDGDGDPDLVVTTEWGPVRIFRNEGGHFTAWDWPLRWAGPAGTGAGEKLGSLAGWWNGIAVADVDGDGRPDLIASNWGLNWETPPGGRREVRLYFGDFAFTGGVDLLEAHADPTTGQWFPDRPRNVLERVLPELREHFPTFAAYGRATVEELLGDHLKQARQLSANWFLSTVFLNRGTNFLVCPLPAEAQFAPAFGVVAADFDGDGLADIFLAQNFFGGQANTTRQDAGRGLLLRGDGRGGFAAVAARDSGIRVDGEGRGAAAADFDQDGRIDLCVAQHRAATCLFQNTFARPGLRVKLHGSATNPRGIGTALRWQQDGRSGPLIEIRAGGGYWSQDGSTVVTGVPDSGAWLWVRSPHGRMGKVAIPPAARDLDVTVE